MRSHRLDFSLQSSDYKLKIRELASAGFFIERRLVL